MINLRPYQENIISELRNSIKNNNKRIVLCAPTGSGKTLMFSYMVSEHFKRGGKILILTHRKELLTQAGGAFEKFGLKPTYIEAGVYPSLETNIHVSMVETFCRRIEMYLEFLKSRTLIIFDESHLENFTKIFEYINQNTIVIGATATPFRKGKQNDLSDFYTDLIQTIDTQDLIDLKYLSKAFSYGLDINVKGLKKIGDDYDMKDYYEENKIYNGVLFNYKKNAENQKTLLFASNIESSKKMRNEFLNAGYKAEHIDGNTPDIDREKILSWFKNTDDAIICNCGVLTTGFDQPDIKCIILYRATSSLPLFLQMVGRGSRITESKNTFTILDFGGNIQRLGFWQDRRVWTLKKKKSKEGVSPTKVCPSCGAILNAKETECEYCGHIFVLKKKPGAKFIELKLLEQKEKYKIVNASSLSDKAEMCKAKVISPFWVLHNLTDIEDARFFCEQMGYKKGFEQLNINRFKVFKNGRR